VSEQKPCDVALNGTVRDAARTLQAHDAVDQLGDAAVGFSGELQKVLHRHEGGSLSARLMDGSERALAG